MDLLEHENVIEGWEGWALCPNDDVVIGPPIVVVKNQRLPTQKPLHVKGFFQPSPATQLEDLANPTPTSSCYPSHYD